MSFHSGQRISVLNVAEKPSVAKAVSEILSRGGGGYRARPGRSCYNRVFEFDLTIKRQQCHMLFTSVTGHLMELDFDDRYRKWNSCDPTDLYHAPVRKYVPQDKLDIKRTLEEEAMKCQWLILWLDCDREGENIAFEVIDVCTAVNHNLNIWRARFSALIDREIHQSVQNLGRPNKYFADAVDARQEIDLRIGASFTRFQTMLLKDSFALDVPDETRNVVLSYGPCQFPTLGFIVERYWEIQSHEPEDFWTINCSHVIDGATASFKWKRDRLFDFACSIVIYEICVEEPTATVKTVKHQEKLKYPPYPLSTIEIQKRASRYFRMSSEHTMKVAEDLYQAGFISYPRTETDSFSVNTDLHAIVQQQTAHQIWGSYAELLLNPEARLWRNPGNGGHDDKAHPPIHPTQFTSGESRWSPDHHKIYELVTRHFLACVSQPAVGAETIVDIDIAGEQFSVSGRTIIAKNYLDVYRFDNWGGSIIPTYQTGQQFLPTTLTLDPGSTRPPPLLSESDLLSCMDKAGIGTDATMHDHIKKLLDRRYVIKDQNTRFSPTNLGEALVMGYDDMGYELWKPDLRSTMEDDMKLVSLGTKTKNHALRTSLEKMEACFIDAKLKKIKLMEAMGFFFERTNRTSNDHSVMENVCPCSLCQEANMVLKQKPDGSFMVGCSNFPMCRKVVWLPGSISEANVTSDICNSCTPGPVHKIRFKFRRLEIPPNYDVHHLGCIGGCDITLKELTEICGTGSRNHSSVAGSGNRASEPPSNQRRANARQISCSNCRQTGHSSRTCPSQSSNSTPQPSRGHNSQNGNSSVLCGSCGAACVMRTANTEANRGRRFYTCQSQGCGFFIWEDNLENAGIANQLRRSVYPSYTRPTSNTVGIVGRGRSRGRGRNQGGQRGWQTTNSTFVTATGEPLSGRRCEFLVGRACNREITWQQWVTYSFLSHKIVYFGV
ncbi:DNA topoisomerase [Zostera marina]|uniref:DNA topoisomerase n=1 Tax=Zostera marina TaxID=29655 RepID=A0A0K9Q068_ZOSMR|nr:DNA topoisomerase [Zostera marina]